MAWVLCVLAGCTVLYARGEGEVLIHVEGHPEALPVATEVLASTGALLEGQHGGVESLQAVGGEAAERAEAKDENEAMPVHYARQLKALEAGAAPSEADDEGAMPLVGPWGGARVTLGGDGQGDASGRGFGQGARGSGQRPGSCELPDQRVM